MINILYIISFFCAIVTAFHLITGNISYKSHSNHRLAAFFLSISYCILLYLLISSGWILKVPYLYKTAMPFNFLSPVLAYLYVRSVLYNETKFSKKDFWHFAAFVLVVVNYISFYFMPVNDKFSLLEALSNDKYILNSDSGILSEFIIFLFRQVQWIVYTILMWRLLIKFKKESLSHLFQPHIKQVVKWLKVFSTILSILLLSFIIVAVLIIFKGKNNATSFKFISLSELFFAIICFVLSSYLLLRPKVLFGFPFIPSNSNEDFNANQVLPENEREQSEKNFTDQITLIQNYFENGLPYLNPKLSIADIAVAIGLSVRDISFIINNHFNQRVAEYINGYRIKYVEQQIREGDLLKFTIASLSIKAGFTSIRTFNRAFQKKNLCSPADYYKKCTPSVS